MKILLVLGVGPAPAALADALRALDWSVIQDPAGADAALHVAAGGFDAALIDCDAGIAATDLEALRAAGPDLAILAAGRAPSLAAMERLFRAGADDVLSLPVHPAEVALRARAIACRRHGHGRDVIRFGPLAVLPGSHAEVDGAPLRLTLSEFRLLERLALSAGRVVDRDTLMSALYGGPEEPCAKVLDVFLVRVRKVLAASGAPSGLVETVWGRGWRLPAPFAEAVHRALPSASSRRIIANERAARAAAEAAA